MKSSKKEYDAWAHAASYRGVVEAPKGQLLLGGSRVVQSIRFPDMDSANAWIRQCVETNMNAGRAVQNYYCVPSKYEPEVTKGAC